MINNEKYNQSSRMRTYKICHKLQEAKGDVGVVIKYVGKRFFNRNLALCDNEKPRANDLKMLYTVENIKKEREVYLASHQIMRVDFRDEDYKLYKYSLKVIREYCDNNSNMSDQERFCLYFFLGNLYSRLHQFSQFGFECGAKHGSSFACEYYDKALVLAEKLKEINFSNITRIFEGKLAKYQAVRVVSGNIDSPESALLSETYIDKEIYDSNDLSLYGLNDLPELFKSIGCMKFSQLVLKLNALDSINHKRFKIVFVSKIFGRKETTAGTYNLRNTVRVLVEKSRPRAKIRCILLHELIHKAMDRTYENGAHPYRENDEKAKQAYSDAMRQVLLNLIDFAEVNGDEDKNKLAFNELVHFCFGDELILNRVTEKNDVRMLSLFKSLKSVFLVYKVSELDVEFITNSLQCLAEVENNSAYIRCIQPLLAYIDHYVIPEMEKYIKEHRWNGRLFS